MGDMIRGLTPHGEGVEPQADGTVRVEGFVHRIRDMGGFSFLVIRTGRRRVQCVLEEGSFFPAGTRLETSDTVRVVGERLPEPRAEGGFEIRIREAEILSRPTAVTPVPLTRRKMDISLDVNLDHRPISLRHPRERAIFVIAEALVQAYRAFLTTNGFTEVHTPKIQAAGAEGGANIFKLDYFGKHALLGQSPQFYKHMMVGVFGRVFEVAPVFRAEKHNTVRHLNEYVGMDFEMGFIRGMADIMETEVAMLRQAMAHVRTSCAAEISLRGVDVPEVGEVPVLKFRDAKRIVVEEFGKKLGGHGDLDPEEEVLLCEYAKRTHGSDFVFITQFPSARRPFYAMDDPEDPGYALSFDLLFRGLEITTGGQRIHDHAQQVAKMHAHGLDPADFQDYLQIHACGMPPHGGLGLGLERLTAQLLKLKNVRQASLFPRDLKRMLP